MRAVAAVFISMMMVFSLAAPASAASENVKWANSDKSNCSFYAKGPGAAQVTIKPGSSRKDSYNHAYIPKSCSAKVTRGLGPTGWPESGKWIYMPPNAWSTWVFRVSKK